MKRNWSNTDMFVDEGMAYKKAALVERNCAPDGVALINPNAVGRKTRSDLVELAMEIEQADSFVKATACNKLHVIAQQVRFLQQQALDILEEAKRNRSLHHAACNFKKVSGNVYYLYRRHSGQEYFSILCPDEWPTCPHEFVGAYKLEADQSWTPSHKIDQRDNEFGLLNKILDTSDSVLKISYSIDDSPMES